MFDAIWQDTFVTDDALIRTIKEIRRELGDDPSSPVYIETVRKRGYRFIGKLEPEANGRRQPIEPAEVKLSETKPEWEESARKDEPVRPSIARTAGPYLVLLVLALTAAGAWYFAGGNSNSGMVRSVSVMPIAVEPGNSDIEHFADGLTESLIARLSKVPGLNVRPSSTVFRFKGRDMIPSQIGQELKTDAVVTGRLVRSGEQMVLYLSLADTANNNNIWSSQYSGAFTDLLTLQASAGRELMQVIAENSGGALPSKAGKDPTTSFEAYQAYSMGRYHLLSTRSRAGETASEYFKKAIAMDPAYALAYAALANSAMGLAFRSEVPSTEAFSTARQAATKAVELDNELADAYVALGQVSFWHDWDRHTAEKHFRRALELEPEHPEAHFALGGMLACSGKAEGLNYILRSKEIDPINLRNNAVYSQFLTFAGRPEESLAESKKILELQPDFYLAHLTTAQAHLAMGAFDKAVDASKAAAALNPVDTTPRTFIAYALARSGKSGEAEEILGQILKLADERPVTPYNVAMIYAGLGDKERAFTWLRLALQQRDLRLAFLAVEPKWNEMRTDPRFTELLEKVGLPL
jgi:TolB-like protein/Flp pilus assembly protein TadD